MILTPCKNRPVLEPCTLPELSYQIDPYIGCEHYCYYCYVLPRAVTDWRKEILIHENMTGRLEKALAAIPPQTIYMGWHTDPYQPCEAQCRQTRQVLELLLGKGFSASILTKSDLVLRDMDVLQSMENAAVSVSVAFSDNDVRRLFEANTIDTEKRILALQKLKPVGIQTSALICPVIPYITGVKPLIDMLAGHADKIWIYGLSILNKSDRNWQNVDKILEEYFSDIKSKIESTIFSKDNPYWHHIRQDLLAIASEKELNLSIHI
jgi:DNA repair photolyase